MLWLERPPLVRWLGAAALVAVAAWSELAPPATTTANYLTRDIPAGTSLTPEHVEERRVPTGAVDTVEPSGVAATDLAAGDPLVASMITRVAVPAGWMVIEAPVPAHASPGAHATAVILEDGSAPVEFPSLVVRVEDADPLGGASGTLAVPPEWLGPAAAASAEGRLLIGVETHAR
ncbi:MAG: SAF domain-containing protein [Actinomycetota bacterium]